MGITDGLPRVYMKISKKPQGSPHSNLSTFHAEINCYATIPLRLSSHLIVASIA